MGYYIQTAQPKGKAQQIIDTLDGTEISADEAEIIIREDMGAVICVVDNGPFEAAAYCYNLDEFRVFSDPADRRPKTWVVVNDTDRVHSLTGFRR